MPGEIFVNGAWVNATSLREVFVGGAWRAPLSVEVYSGGAWRVLKAAATTLANFAAFDSSYCEDLDGDPGTINDRTNIYRASLTWDNPAAEAVKVFRDGVLIHTTAAGAVGYTDSPPAPAAYSYSIQGGTSGVALGPISVTTKDTC
jgi:hypothetical protein